MNCRSSLTSIQSCLYLPARIIRAQNKIRTVFGWIQTPVRIGVNWLYKQQLRRKTKNAGFKRQSYINWNRCASRFTQRELGSQLPVRYCACVRQSNGHDVNRSLQDRHCILGTTGPLCCRRSQAWASHALQDEWYKQKKKSSRHTCWSVGRDPSKNGSILYSLFFPSWHWIL